MNTTCSLCGSGLGVGVQFCPNCGAFVDWQDEPDQKVSPAREPPSDAGTLALRVDVSPRDLQVAPGEVADAAITVHNDGTRVEQVVVTATVEGNFVPWLRVQPAKISIYPDSDAEVLLEAAPPRASEHEARTLPYQIHAQSTLDPEIRGGTGGSVVVGAFHDLTATLSPEHLRTRRGGHCHVSIANQGNVAENVQLTGRSQDELRISVARVVQVGPGFRLDVPVAVSAPLRWFGGPAARSFEVEIRSDGLSTPSPLRGTLTHLALVPRGLALAGLAVMGIAAAGFGLTVALADSDKAVPVPPVSPSIEPTAQHRSAPPTVTSRPPITPTVTPTKTSPAPEPSPTSEPPSSTPTAQKPAPPPTPAPSKRTPAESSAPVSSAQAGCQMLEQLVARLDTDQDLIDARPGIGKVIDRIVQSPTQDDSEIIFSNGFVRNALSADPADGRDEWVAAMTSALTNLYSACADAQYISPG